jgi:hypothetical protein
MQRIVSQRKSTLQIAHDFTGLVAKSPTNFARQPQVEQSDGSNATFFKRV